MKKISIILVLIGVLFLGIMKVNADGKLFGISVNVNGTKESENIYENTNLDFANGKVKVNGLDIDNSKIFLNNLGKANFLLVENYSGFSNEINIILTGSNNPEAFDWTGYTGKFNISGSGTLKFKPVSGIGTTVVPGIEVGGVPRYYVTDESTQKSMVEMKIKTSLPITYTDGYVCINCKEETKPSTETPKNETTTKPKNEATTKPTNQTKPAEIKKEYVKTLISTEGIEFTSKSDMESTYKLITKDITNNYNDLKLEENQELISVYDISIINNNETVDMNNGEYTIKIKLSEQMKEYDNMSVVYIKDKQIIETFEPTITNDYLTFTTTHLSEYGIIGKTIQKENIVNEDTKTKTKDANNYTLVIIGAIGIILIITITLFICLKKTKSKKTGQK